MNLTRVRATIVAGILASSMVLPGVTAMAASTTSSVNKDGTSGAVSGAEIKKTVDLATGVSGVPTAHSSVKFSVTQVPNASNLVAPNGYQQRSDANDAISGTVIMDVSNATSVSGDFYEAILSGANITLTDVGEYTFEIKEKTTDLSLADGQQTSFGWSVVSDKTYYLRVLIKNNANKTGTETLYFLTETNVDPATYNGSTNHKLQYAAFDNTYNKKSTANGMPNGTPNTLTVTKQVTNPAYTDDSNEYVIKVTVKLPDTQKDKDGNYFAAASDYTASINTNRSDCTADVTKGDLNTTNGTIEYTASLHDGESIVITDLAEGATYSVEETSTSTDFPNLKETLYKVDGATQGEKTCTDQTFDNNSSTVVVENTFKDVTATGVVTDIAPYLTLILVAGAGVAGYMVLKGRMAR